MRGLNHYKLFLFKAPQRLRRESDKDYAYKILQLVSINLNLGKPLRYKIYNEGNYKKIHAITDKGLIIVKYVEEKEAIAIVKIRKQIRTRFRYFK
ncbi:hypothetical protein V6M85_10020 [Sulfolobus tengchongensis]|uniref:Cytotoxic translational repressor of toxin-antitoxin stability system n=1 Tax=Sulfolobus tengchongensis TaxID=207809 RepID=A0AAX4KY22_9CREN